MSGSPIIQNNKIVGAVTHVLINKPDTGYGIYIEWMLKDSKILNNCEGCLEKDGFFIKNAKIKIWIKFTHFFH